MVENGRPFKSRNYFEKAVAILEGDFGYGVAGLYNHDAGSVDTEGGDAGGNVDSSELAACEVVNLNGSGNIGRYLEHTVAERLERYGIVSGYCNVINA